MLLWFVILYLMISVGIGLWAATRVHSAKDFAVAGRSLPLPVVTATVFATWFGAEAIFGIPATFVQEGLGGVVADPFGSSMCLILAGLFFSTQLYKLNILTLGDFYRMRYNRTVEVITTICIVLSYLGWVAAQIKALGLIFNVVTHGAMSQEAGMILGAAIVLTYTTFGGMFSVAFLDFVQMMVSMGGLLFIGWTISGMTGGVAPVIEQASQAGKLEFFPWAAPLLWVTFLGAWLTMMLGSIRSRMSSNASPAKMPKVASGARYWALDLFLLHRAYVHRLRRHLLEPDKFAKIIAQDSQLVLPWSYSLCRCSLRYCSSCSPVGHHELLLRCSRPRCPSPKTW